MTIKSTRSLAPCFYSVAIDILGYGLVYPLIAAMFAGEHSSFFTKHHISSDAHFFYLSAIYVLYPLFMFFGSSFITDLADTLGRKKVLILSMALLCLSFWLMGNSVEQNSFVLFLCGRALSGFAAGSQPLAHSCVAELSPLKFKARNLGIIAICQASGLILGPLIGGVFSDTNLNPGFGYEVPFYIAAGAAGVGAVWMAFSLEEIRSRGAKQSAFNILRPVFVFLDAFKQKSLRIVAFGFLLVQIAFGIYFQIISIFLKDIFRYQSWELGLFYAFLGAAFPVGLGFARYLSSRISMQAGVLWGLFALSASLSIAALSLNHELVWFAGFLFAVTDMLAYVSMIRAFSHALEKKRQHWDAGTFGALIGVGFIISGFGPNLLDVINTESILFVASAIAAVAWLTMTMHYKVSK